MISILQHELMYYFKNKIEAIQFTILFVSIILLIPFGQSSGAFNCQALAGGITFIALVTAVNIGGIGLFQRDFESGKLEAYQTSHLSLEVVVLAKWLAFSLMVILPINLITPAMLMLLNLPIQIWPHYAVGLTSGALALTTIMALSSVLMLGQKKVGAMMMLIVLPLTIPVIIFGAHYLVSPQLFQQSLLFLWGFTILMLPILCLIGASCIRNSH